MKAAFARGLAVLLFAHPLFACSNDSSSGPVTPVVPPIADATTIVQINDLVAGAGFARISGAASTGRFGVPVAGGVDIDGDGFEDVAMSNMQAAPFGRKGAGQAVIVFGDGTFGISQDTATPGPNVLVVAGAAPAEAAAGEIWLADVTGDGRGDLLLGRQNFREPLSGRIGAGALSIIVGSPVLRDLARNGQILDMAAPPAGVNVVTLVGANELDRLGFWMRAGDATGDGVDDLLVGADQQDFDGDANAGVAWLVRGGAHLDARATIDLADFGSTILSGQIARIEPPPGAENYHFGATVALADLDNNGVEEVLVSAALARVGGLLVADGAAADSAVRVGGNPGGSLFVFWDDNFSSAVWPSGFAVRAGATAGGFSRIDGGAAAGLFTNDRFGEEVIGNRDFDGDGELDLFVGDITGESEGNVRAGVGHLFYSASTLRDKVFSLSAIPADVTVRHVLGPAAGAISSDTSAVGDFDGDGRDDLVIASPLASPEGRVEAGVVHVLWGTDVRSNAAVIELDLDSRAGNLNPLITDLFGGNGQTSSDDTGDTLMYSAATGDLDGDGLDDLIINEMRGNGVAPDALDVGNLLIISGARITKPDG